MNSYNSQLVSQLTAWNSLIAYNLLIIEQSYELKLFVIWFKFN